MLEELGNVDGLCQKLLTDPDRGIDIRTITKRRLHFGENSPVLKKMPAFYTFILECFDDLSLKILAVAAVISLIVSTIDDPEQGWIEGVAILVTIIIVVSVTSLNNYFKEKKFQKLNEDSQERHIPVLREKSEVLISVFDLLVGDIIKVQAGEVMPVDALVIWSMKLEADESTVTGESEYVKKGVKSNEPPFLLSGSKIAEGNGLAMVLAVGKNSFIGKNMEKIRNVAKSLTPLQLKLNYIAELIGKIGFFSALVTLMVLLGYIIYSIIDAGWDKNFIGKIINSFIVAVTIVVVAVPEGLPLAVTLSLAYSVEQMKKKNNLVRHLDASETMGQATCICSDKTGTLTQNIMKVVAMFTQGMDLEVISSQILHEKVKELIIAHICHNTTASFSNVEGKEVMTGNRTEIALLKLVKDWGYDYEGIRDKKIIFFQAPFNSKLKRMDTVVNIEGKMHSFVKGATEEVLDLCKYYINSQGQVKELKKEMKEGIESEIISKYSAQAYRTLAMGYKIVDHFDLNTAGEPSLQDMEEDLILLCIVGIEDPLREGVPDAVSICQGAGITVRMVTGDNRETAIAIANKCGILPLHLVNESIDDFVYSGEKFRTLVEGLMEDPENPKDFVVRNLGEFKRIVKKMRVLYRSSPSDKFLLVTGLRQLKEVVAVTGDGSNDAPALKKSNIGFAMHLAGTQLAQEASDIILLDDNFSSILTAILWGRNIYDSISKFIQFQLTVNVIALVVCFVGAVIIRETPLTAVQMLWVNLIMDSLAALALATEPPHANLLKRSPVKHNESLLTLDMVKNIIGQFIYQMAALMFILFWLPDLSEILTGDAFPTQIYDENWDFNNATHFTVFFHTFVLMQNFNLINCRKLKSSEANVFKGFTNNWLFTAILIGVFVVQYLLVQFGGEPLACVPLTLGQHLFCLIVGIGALIFGIFFRFVPLAVFKCCKISQNRIKMESKGEFTSFLRRKEHRSFLSSKSSISES